MSDEFPEYIPGEYNEVKYVTIKLEYDSRYVRDPHNWDWDLVLHEPQNSDDEINAYFKAELVPNPIPFEELE